MIWTAIKTILTVAIIGGAITFFYLVYTAEDPVYDVTIYVTYQDNTTEVIKRTINGLRPNYNLDAGCVEAWRGNGGGVICGVKKFSYTAYRKKDLEVKK